jgi:hypothetical protein
MAMGIRSGILAPMLLVSPLSVVVYPPLHHFRMTELLRLFM